MLKYCLIKIRNIQKEINVSEKMKKFFHLSMKESKNTNEPGVTSSFKLPDAAVDKMTFAP